MQQNFQISQILLFIVWVKGLFVEVDKMQRSIIYINIWRHMYFFEAI